MKKLIYIFVFLFAAFNMNAQDVQVNVSMDTNFILIGEQTQIKLKVQYRLDGDPISVQFPQLNDTINEFIEVVFTSALDTVYPDESDLSIVEQTQKITITSFDSGHYEIPSFRFVVNKDTLETEPLFLEVQTLQVDTAEAIFDVKAPLEEPFSLKDWLKENWPWVVGGLAFIIALILLVRYLKNKKPAEVIEEVKPVIPPHVIALEQLEKVRDDKLWQDGKVKLYHSHISEILRTYIELRYQFHALEETTTEIIHGLRLHGIDSQVMTKLNQTLVLADLVKFAKEKPLANENDMSMSNAIDFINNTKLIAPPISENAQ